MKIAVTGHRPDKLYGYDLNDERYEALINRLTKAIEEASNGEDDILGITGMALGVDMLFIWSLVDYEKEHKDKKITIEGAIPFENQPNKWQLWDRKLYESLLDDIVDIKTYVDTIKEYKWDKKTPVGEYSPMKLEARNRYMIDKCDVLIAVYDGYSKGGTHNAINYAKKLGKKIIFVPI